MADIWLTAKVPSENLSWWFRKEAKDDWIQMSDGRKCRYWSLDADKDSDCWVCFWDDGLIEFGEPAV